VQARGKPVIRTAGKQKEAEEGKGDRAAYFVEE
jgi:hypothetical protein